MSIPANVPVWRKKALERFRDLCHPTGAQIVEAVHSMTINDTWVHGGYIKRRRKHYRKGSVYVAWEIAVPHLFLCSAQDFLLIRWHFIRTGVAKEVEVIKEGEPPKRLLEKEG